MFGALTSLTGGGGLSSSNSMAAQGGNQTTSNSIGGGVNFGYQGEPASGLSISPSVALLGVAVIAGGIWWVSRK